MDALDMQAAFGPVIEPPGTWSGTSTVGQAVHLAEVIQSRIKDFDADVEEIRADRHLSSEGKQEKIAELGRSLMERLDRYEQNVPTWTTERDDLQDSIEAALKGDSDSSSEATREAEVRALLLAMPVEDRMSAFEDAIEVDDDLFLRAIFRAPRVMHILPNEVLEHGKAEVVARADPELVQELEGMTQSIDQLAGHLHTARQVIRRVASLPEADPIAEAAKSGEGLPVL